MSIVNFENLKVTTMTVIVNLDGDAYIDTAFSLLPITRLLISDKLKKKKKIKIPWPGIEYTGNIFSAKFQGYTRGIIKSTSGKSFRNSVAIEICTSKKNISAKLVKNKIHMCGATSKELAIETAEHIISHLYDIQTELDYIKSHQSELQRVVDWLVHETVGDKFIVDADSHNIVELEEGEHIVSGYVRLASGEPRYVYREKEFSWEHGDKITDEGVFVDKNGNPYFRNLSRKEKKEGVEGYPIMMIDENLIYLAEEKIPKDPKNHQYKKVVKTRLKTTEVTGMKIPECVMENNYPEDIDPRIASFLIKYIQDFSYHDTYVEFLNSIKHREQVCSPNLAIHDLNIAMINYSYTLKMNINRKKLSQLIDGYNGFDARYDNTTDHHVTITLPYVLEAGSEMIKRKNKNLCHTFMVYKSGIVTQSGPSPEIMESAYYQFINFIEQHRDEIKQKGGKSFSIKYRPVSSEEYSRDKILVV